MPKSKDVLIAHRITIGEHHQYKEGLTHSQVDILIRQGYKVEAVQLADQSAVLAENEACAKAVANIPAPADDRASLYILGHAAALRSANEAIRARHK